MKINGTKNEKPGGGGRDWAQLEGLRRFVAARFVVSPHRLKNDAGRACALARPRAFSREVVGRHARLPVADTLGFLRSLYGRGRPVGELPGYRSDLTYREPGKTFQQTFYNWFLQSALSLTVNRLEQRFAVWLNQTYAPRTVLNLEHKPFPAAQIHRQAAAREVFLRQSAPDGDAVARVIESTLRELHVRDAGRHVAQVLHPASLRQTPRDASGAYLVKTLREFESSFKGTIVNAARRHEQAVTRAAVASREFVIHVLSRLTVPPLPARDSAAKAGGVYLAVPPAMTSGAARTMPAALRHVRSASGTTRESASGRQSPGGALSHAAVVPAGLPDSRATVEPFGLSGSRTAVVPIRLADSQTKVVPVGRAGSRAMVAPVRLADWFGRRPGTGLSLVKVETPRVGPAVGFVLKTGWVGVPWDDADVDAPAPSLGRDLAARTMLAARTIRAYRPATEGRRHEPGGGFTFLRREDQLRPPSQSYAFAQPVRPAPTEAPAVGQVREKEVEELVRKQVETAMKSRSPVAGLSRSDYSRLADHVYSSLARRLVIDKERSGLHR